MFEGGGEPARKAGCEDYNKCCLCIPIDIGMKIVTIFGWLWTASMIGVAIGMSEVNSAVSSVSDSYSVSYGTSASFGLMTSLNSLNTLTLKDEDKKAAAALKKVGKEDHYSSDPLIPFLIISYVAAAFLLIASLLMSYWMCCGKGTAAAKKLEYGTIC